MNMTNSAIQFRQRQINEALNTLEAGYDNKGRSLDAFAIKRLVNRIKFCQAVIKAHQS